MIPATLADVAGNRRHVELPGTIGPEYIIDRHRLYARQPGPWTDREVYNELHSVMTLEDAGVLARLEGRQAATNGGAAGDMGHESGQENAA